MFSPNAPRISNADGTYSTHEMAWEYTDGGAIAFPTIIQQKDGSLVRLDPKAAMEHALRTGEFKRFSNPKDAEAYASGGYKPKQ